MSRRPWAAIAFALALLIVTTLPYLLAWGQSAADWRFSGFLFGVEDGHWYLAMMRQGAAGELAFTAAHTSESHAPVPGPYLHYIVPGWVIGRFVPETSPQLTGALIGAFNVMRLAAAAIYLAVLYRFISAFVLTPRLRLLAFALATIGGGFGWLFPLTGGGQPPEIYSPEGFGFLSLWGLPHLLSARALLLGGLLLTIHSAEHDRAWRSAAGAALCWALMGMIVPFYPIVVIALLAAWAGMVWLRAKQAPWRLARRSAFAVALMMPVPAYFYVVFSTHPVLAVVSAQSPLPSPPPQELLLSYLPLLIPALTALPFVWSVAWEKGRLVLLVAWPLAALHLAYAPLSVQRRLLEGVIVPLAILAAIGLAGWARRGRASRGLAVVTVALASLSTAVLLLGGTGVARSPGSPVFRPREEAVAFDWLNAHSIPGDVALAAFETGNSLPAYTHLRPLVGHGPGTVAAEAKRALVEAFYRDELSAEERAALLAGPCLAPAPLPCSDPVDYVLFGPLEQVVADSATPGRWAEGLTLIYDEQGYAIFAVISDPDR